MNNVATFAALENAMGDASVVIGHGAAAALVMEHSTSPGAAMVALRAVRALELRLGVAGAAATIAEDADLIRSGSLVDYLRARRPGRTCQLSRAKRVYVWIAVVLRDAARRADERARS